MTPFAVLAGKLLGTSYAAGLNLYATVALLGLASRLHWMPQLPAGLRGLENGVVIGTAVVLFIVEFIVEKVKYAGAVWDAVHTIVRPFAAAMLALLALETMPWEIRLAAVVLCALVAFAAHSSQAGLRVILANSRFAGGFSITVVTLIIDAIAIAIAVATLIYPTVALAGVCMALGLSLLVGPRLWRAAGFGAESVIRRVRRFFGKQGWRPRERLPRSVRAVVPEADLGTSPTRCARAAAVGVPGAGGYRIGWLVVGGSGNAFVFKSFISARRIELPALGDAAIEPGPLSDAIQFGDGAGHFTLLLLKDGPPADQALAELRAHA